MKENIESILSQMKKGVLELLVLALLDEKEDYPAGLISRLSDAGLNVVEGTLYPLLTRLKNSGYLSYRWEESASGPPRKYFRLTDDGKKYLKELKTSWKEFQSIIEIILK
ncbi:MAG: PadR family transcriptional regulator [Bacteroidia bacterium]|nr:PadR family transcriptional regulator [Bacteroidia bacterium]